VELPSSVAALVVAIFAVLPGMPGEKAYRILVGSDWREDKWQRTLRLLAFSVAGFAIYATLAPLLGAPAPTYLSPANLQMVDAAKIGEAGVALLGHMSAATMAGILAGLLSRMVARFVARSAYSSAWDHFVNRCVKQHWVIVGLQNGDVYLGYLDVADLSVAAAERDIILREPALYDVPAQRYRATSYQSLFLPGAIVSSVGVVTDKALDKRITQPGELLFNDKENENG
jgi:Family of unknown function (DUF6338)